MSDAVILALIASIAGPLVGAIIYVAKTAYSDNRESWRQRAEAAEARTEAAESREEELKQQLLPAVKELIGGVTALAEGREKDREFYRRVEPAIQRIDRIVADTLGEDAGSSRSSQPGVSRESGKEHQDEPA